MLDGCTMFYPPKLLLQVCLRGLQACHVDAPVGWDKSQTDSTGGEQCSHWELEHSKVG